MLGIYFRLPKTAFENMINLLDEAGANITIMRLGLFKPKPYPSPAKSPAWVVNELEQHGAAMVFVEEDDEKHEEGFLLILDDRDTLPKPSRTWYFHCKGAYPLRQGFETPATLGDAMDHAERHISRDLSGVTLIEPDES
ncbi:MAG: hypothetical protein D6790_06495 [Caldilineae bacterium]|nr:MAG: hypothetical protein D6790_06495 [Caldilineae bacterium]